MVWVAALVLVASACAIAEAPVTCEALAGVDFSRIPDAPTQITEAKSAGPSGDTPGHCQVGGYVTPSVGFLLRLPAERWNGKFIELGCGGFCGATLIFQCDDPLRRGYACIVSDMGHKGSGGAWAYNNLPAQIDFGYRATHVTAVAGKAITERYYGLAPKYAYFQGCSTGGRQALVAAQRFPWDFDGIVAGAPVVSVPEIHMSLLWLNRALTGKTGEPLFQPADLEVLHRAAVAKCDMNDGIEDGLIGDPRACVFNPAELLCGANESSECLRTEQVAAADKVYGSPVTSRGEQIYVPSVLRGSERTWLDWSPHALYAFVADSFRYFSFHPAPGPEWKPEDFDFDRDYRRLGVAQALTAAVNPDLRRFKAAGGKLLSYMGWNDSGVTPLPTVDYYETVERTMGGRAAAQEFFRLFMIPGMNHCAGGDGASAVDYLSYLEAWVEHGRAPDKLIGSHVRAGARTTFPLDPATIEFSRPIYPYPVQVKYSGRGDPKEAASFRPAQR